MRILNGFVGKQYKNILQVRFAKLLLSLLLSSLIVVVTIICLASDFYQHVQSIEYLPAELKKQTGRLFLELLFITLRNSFYKPNRDFKLLGNVKNIS